MTPSNREERPKGYLSEEHKRSYTLTAGILGAVFFVIQFIFPFIIMMAVMPAMMFSDHAWMKRADIERGAFWNNRVWYLEESISPQTADHPRANLCSLDTDSEEGPKSAGAVSINRPWLLGGSDRLWIISSSGIGYYKDDEITVLSTEKKLGDISRPFLYEGLPAVVEDRPDGLALTVFSDGAWQRSNPLELKLQEKKGCVRDCLQVVAKEGKLFLFLQYRETLYYKEVPNLPEADIQAGNQNKWQPVSETKGRWSSVWLNDAPAVFFCPDQGPETKITGLILEDKTWKPLFSYDGGMAIEIGAFSLDRAGAFALLIQSFPGSLRMVRQDGEKAVKEIRYKGQGFPFFRIFKIMMVGFYTLSLLLPLILAIILSALMRKHRAPDYETGSAKRPFGSLTRRALSQIIDTFIVGGPLIVGIFFIFPIFDMEKMFNPNRMLAAFALIPAGLGWGVLCLLVFSFLEGRWGATPGKWALGIRVIGTDLKPCGFGRALIRNLLKFVDGFFNYLVGILLAALSENRQRLGDMAANTVVIDAREKLTLNVERDLNLDIE